MSFPTGTPELPHDCIHVADWTPFEVPPESNDYRHGARASLELALSSDLLYFLSRGSLANGVVEISEDDDVDDSEVANVDVTFLFQDPNALDHAKVCRLQKAEGKNGVGIIVSAARCKP